MKSMSDLTTRIGALSPRQRELLERRLKKQATDCSQIPILPRKDRERKSFPASFAQQRLWFLDQLEPGASVYNMPAAIRAVGRLDVAALGRSLNEVVRRHEALRTTFAKV